MHLSFPYFGFSLLALIIRHFHLYPLIITCLSRALLFPVYLLHGTFFGPCISYLLMCDSHHLGSMCQVHSLELPL